MIIINVMLLGDMLLIIIIIRLRNNYCELPVETPLNFVSIPNDPIPVSHRR